MEVKKSGLSIGQCAQGYRMFQMMKLLGIKDEDKDEDMNEDSNSNTKINYNEFSSFVKSIYLNCKNHGIEPYDIFSWINDLHEQFIPSVSTLPSSFYSGQKQENQLIPKNVPLISQISFFIDQKKKRFTQLENYRKDLEKEINELIIERNNLKIENEKLTKDNKKIILYLDWYYKLKTELWESYSIGVDDFEKFAKLINDFRNLDLEIPKIIDKYLTVNSMEDKIQEETQRLERLKMQTAELNNNLLYGQDEINKYKQSLDTYQQLKSMGFGLKEIKQLRYTILEIAAANNISNDKAILKFLKDLEEQYDNKLGFDLKIDEQRKEINKLNSHIINYQYTLNATPFIGAAISSLFQKGIFEQDIIAVNQLVDEYINNNMNYDNKNNNDSIKKNVSKAERLERLINDIQNYKNIIIEIKDKQSELDSLQKTVNDLYNQKQQIEKLLQNFKSMINSINNKLSYHKEYKNHFDIFSTVNLSSTSYPLIFINKNSDSDINMEKE
jgi:DNA repair exonuclease SbcCD ATPase subunit